MMNIDILGVQVQLLAQKAVYLTQQKILVIADMHLGKLVHFRRNGLFIPIPEFSEELEILKSLITKLEPKEVVFLGDLFHSEKNSVYQQFVETILLFPNIEFTLTKGNHDLIPDFFFKECKVSVVAQKIVLDTLVLTHQVPKQINQEVFYIVGHMHPGYRIVGRGRQIFRLPCFHLGVNFLTLPAFGKHTGLFIPNFLETDKIYVILNEEVVQIP